MKATSQGLAQLRKYFTDNARQVQVEGVADAVAVGYVRHYGNQFSYAVFYGKQAKPAKHYSAKDEAQAEQRIIELLTQAGKVAALKAEDRKKSRAPFHDRQEGEVTCRSYTVTGTAQLIREALKAAFPGVKFSVTSDSFANGTSVSIAYTDGPSRRQVEQVYAPLESGQYNSQEEIYEYSREATTIDSTGKLFRMSYGAKYISESRSYSPAYGFFLNSLNLCQAPTLAEQFAAFESWHRAQRYEMQTSWGENADTYTVSSTSSHGDLERFAEALTVQGYTVRLTKVGDELTLSTRSAGSTQAAPVVEPVATSDETDREYYAAEMQWLADPSQDRTDHEFEAAERSWLA
ncbi:LPD29 domain-containing protein [Hymenobacter psoromatis]|uniref:LPD29 domain-containing protein n=1 Tax=Hymenobacter psoromatis TaxID=1484116 RepID=UPI001CC13A3E|nr:LPD29 domain-containing protein [Hymenobacter psoromatis]